MDAQNGEENPNKRIPKNSAFYQQNHRTFMLRYNPLCAAILYLVIACILIPIGAVLLQESENVVEIRERYDDE
jgi:hypothetical protein